MKTGLPPPFPEQIKGVHCGMQGVVPIWSHKPKTVVRIYFPQQCAG